MASAKGIMAIERGLMSALSRERLLEKQGHSCAICGELAERLVLDHDHSTGQVRGYLCNRCNLKIGHVERRGGVDISDPFYNQVLDYLHHPPVTGCGICFLGPLKVQAAKGIMRGGRTIFYPEKANKMILSAPDYMTAEESIDFLGPLLVAAKEAFS